MLQVTVENTFFRCPKGKVELLEEVVSTKLHLELSLQMMLQSGMRSPRTWGLWKAIYFTSFIASV